MPMETLSLTIPKIFNLPLIIAIARAHIMQLPNRITVTFLNILELIYLSIQTKNFLNTALAFKQRSRETAIVP